MLDKNTILINFGYFLGLSWLLSTNAKSAKSADFENDYMQSASINTKSTCTKGIYIKNTCIGDTYIRNICIKSTCIKGIYIRNT